MSKELRIFCGRGSLIGDIVTYLPFLIYLEKKFLGSYKIFCLSPKCQQMMQVLGNHPLIDRIHFTTFHDALGPADTEILQTCQKVYEPNPPVVDGLWFNKISLVQQQFQMSYDYIEHRFHDSNDFAMLDELERKPKLTQWFDVKPEYKKLAIWPFAGYTLADETSRKRSPSLDKWQTIVQALHKQGYTTVQFGHPNCPDIGCNENKTRLGFFDSIVASLGCTVSIGTDSGSMHVLGAYGAKQICITTNWREGHVTNFSALAPVNWRDTLKNLFYKDDINKVQAEEILCALHEIC